MNNEEKILQEKLNKKCIVDYMQSRIIRYNLKYNSPSKICSHMISTSIKSFTYSFQNNKKSSTKLKILFKLDGGLGDIIIGLNFITYFYRRFCINTKNIIYVYADNIHILKELAPDFIIVKEKTNIKEYDLTISIMRCIDVKYADINKIATLSKDLFDFISKYVKFYEDNNLFINLSPYRDSITNNIFSSSIKRWHQPDILDLFNMQEEFILPVKVENFHTLQKKFNLKDKFITISREVGHENLSEGTKLWSLENYRNLVEKIKNHFPDYQIIEVGTGKGERIGNTHLNLAGKTSLSEIKVLMKYARLHIDIEGGLTHLRHLVQGGKSVVLFGPTSPEVYGYSENINICSKACPIHCEFYFMNWQKGCHLQANHNCMKSITSEMVFNEIKKELSA